MKNRKVYLYVFNTMSDWEYGHLIAELNSGRYFKRGLEALKIITVGINDETITTMGGLAIQPDISIDACILKPEDVIILPGGNTWGEESHQRILSVVGEALDQGTTIAAICGATDALANHGYLDTRRHTSNDLGYTKMVCPNYKGEKFYEPKAAVVDENLITSSGVSFLEFAMEVINKLDVFKPDTLEAWYALNKTQNPENFFQLMNSLN